jgi:hypothetical protein
MLPASALSTVARKPKSSACSGPTRDAGTTDRFRLILGPQYDFDESVPAGQGPAIEIYCKVLHPDYLVAAVFHNYFFSDPRHTGQVSVELRAIGRVDVHEHQFSQ